MDKNPKHTRKMTTLNDRLRASYEAPEAQPLPLLTDGAVCQTSLGAGEIQPGTGENWGNL